MAVRPGAFFSFYSRSLTTKTRSAGHVLNMCTFPADRFTLIL